MYSVFISHSMRQEDLAIIYDVVRDAVLRGITCYVAERDVQLGKSLPVKIENAIRACDCFAVFLTKGGSASAWVNQEIGFARACGRLRIQIVEKGVEVQGFDVGNEYVVLDRANPAAAISALNEHLVKLKNAKEAQQQAGLVIVGILALLALIGGSK